MEGPNPDILSRIRFSVFLRTSFGASSSSSSSSSNMSSACRGRGSRGHAEPARIRGVRRRQPRTERPAELISLAQREGWGEGNPNFGRCVLGSTDADMQVSGTRVLCTDSSLLTVCDLVGFQFVETFSSPSTKSKNKWELSTISFPTAMPLVAHHPFNPLGLTD